MSTVTQRYTPEDLERMPDGDRFELVDGELLELHMGAESDVIGGKLFVLLNEFCQANGSGRAMPPTGYQCFPEDPGKVRRPDASFISFDRLPSDQPLPRGYFRIVPDLAVEVVSPNDLDEDVDAKVQEYLSAGVRLVWVVKPLPERVHVYRADGSASIIDNKGYLDGEDVLPGFRCPVASIFPLPRPKVEFNA